MKRILHIIIPILLASAIQAADLSVTQIDSIADVRTAAISAYRKQEMQLACNLYKQSIAMGDSSIIPFYNLACCYGRMGKADSCKAALKQALERGYPDYMELGTDPDLQLFQTDPETFKMLWQKAFANSYGKVLTKNYNDLLMRTIINQDTARLPFLLSFEHRKRDQLDALARTLQTADTLLKFSSISEPKVLTEKGRLEKRSLNYTNNHFVTSDEFVYELTVPYFDADFAQLIAHNRLHIRQHTIDHLYTYLDTLFIEHNQLQVQGNTPSLPELTDSVMMLILQSHREKIDDYQEKVSREWKLCKYVMQMLRKSTPISENEFRKLQPAEGDICFIRINSLPVRKQFKGLKMAFYKGSPVAVVVIDDQYFFVKGKFKL